MSHLKAPTGRIHRPREADGTPVKGHYVKVTRREPVADVVATDDAVPDLDDE